MFIYKKIRQFFARIILPLFRCNLKISKITLKFFSIDACKILGKIKFLKNDDASCR